jgi:excisionase family DNA binding protein
MGTIQFLQVTPNDLAQLISETVKDVVKDALLEKQQQKPAEGKDLLTRKETSELLQVSLVTVHEWTKTKILTHYKMGNRTYYKRSEVLNKMFNSNTTAK